MNNFFPPQGKNYTYLQTNRSDTLGSLWSSMGLDFQSNLGNMRVGPRLRINTTSADLPNLGIPVGFRRFQSTIWAPCGTRIFRSDGTTPDDPFIEDTSTNAQTDYTGDESDINFFNDVLVASPTDSVWSLDLASGGSWTQRDTLSTGTPHMMAVFNKFNRLYVLNASDTVRSIDSTWTVAVPGTDDYALDLAGGGLVNFLTCIRTTSEFVWLGSISRTAYPLGSVLQWDGLSQQITAEYIIKNASGVMALCVMDNIPYAMDSNGILNKFTGTAFEEVGRLPYTNTLPLKVMSLDNNRFIHPNGLIPTKNGTILALINNELEDSGATILENLPSGIWEWSPDIGFTHKYPLTYNRATSSTINDYGQNRISRAGGLADMNWASTDSDRNGTFLAGATFTGLAGSAETAIFLDDSNDTIQKKGYFVTTWFDSSEVQSKWERLWATYRRLVSASDSMVFKYRITEESPSEGAITWTSATSFTILNSAVDVSQYWVSGTGGEVEIILGAGGASCAHIINAVNNAGTWTVTLDETIAGASNTLTGRARFQKWVKLFPTISSTPSISGGGSYEQMAIGANDVRVQIKGCLTYTGNMEFFKAIVADNPDIIVTT